MVTVQLVFFKYVYQRLGLVSQFNITKNWGGISIKDGVVKPIPKRWDIEQPLKLEDVMVT